MGPNVLKLIRKTITQSAQKRECPKNEPKCPRMPTECPCECLANAQLQHAKRWAQMSRKTYRLPTRMPLKCPARECPKTAYEFPPNAHVNALPMPSSKCPKMNSNVQDRLQNAHANALEMPCSGPSASASTTSPKRNLNAYDQIFPKKKSECLRSNLRKQLTPH